MAEAAIPEDDVGPTELPRLGLESDKLRKKVERDRILTAYDSAARQAAETTLGATADNRQLVVLALARYSATGANELNLEDGDTIRVLRQDPSGWWEGECRGRVGWFPSNFTKVRAVHPAANPSTGCCVLCAHAGGACLCVSPG